VPLHRKYTRVLRRRRRRRRRRRKRSKKRQRNKIRDLFVLTF